MITSQHLGSYAFAEPFRPFRIKMASGRVYEIRHPEMISIGRSSAHIYWSISDDSSLNSQGVREISLLLIESVEPLEMPAKQESK